MEAPVEVRKGKADDLERLAKLADEIFRPGFLGLSRPREFPLLFSKENVHHLYFVEVDGRPVSLIAMWPGKVFLHGVPVSVVAMGSVCTLEAFRKDGYATMLIERALQDFAPNTSLLVVSGGRSLYRRIGCVDFGEHVLARLQPGGGGSVARPQMQFSILPVGEEGTEAQALHALYCAESLRYLRTPEEMRRLLTALSVPRYRRLTQPPRVYTAHQDGRIVAYAIGCLEDLAVDNEPVVRMMEWAGSRHCILPLMEFAQQASGDLPVEWYVASTDVTMMAILREYNVTSEIVPNEGTARVLNPSHLARELEPWVQEHYGATLDIQEVSREEWQVSWQPKNGGSVPNTNGDRLRGYAGLTEWIFGAKGLRLPFPRTDDMNYV